MRELKSLTKIPVDYNVLSSDDVVTDISVVNVRKDERGRRTSDCEGVGSSFAPEVQVQYGWFADSLLISTVRLSKSRTSAFRCEPVLCELL
jgi:hypothetical protein